MVTAILIAVTQSHSSCHASSHQISGPADRPVAKMTPLHALDLTCRAPHVSGNLESGKVGAALIATIPGAVNAANICHTDKFLDSWGAPQAKLHVSISRSQPTSPLLVTPVLEGLPNYICATPF